LRLAFDVYGTLFNPQVPGVPEEIMSEWRQKQLEFSWRLSLMGRWVDFDEVTKLALNHVYRRRGLSVDSRLVEGWLKLEPYDDTMTLRELSKTHTLYTLTNGTLKSIKKLLENAQILNLFTGFYSVEDIKVYKPSPKVYTEFIKRFGDAYLVSSNPWDIAGAKNAGMRAIYVNRHNQPPDPLSDEPDITVKTLRELPQHLQ